MSRRLPRTRQCNSCATRPGCASSRPAASRSASPERRSCRWALSPSQMRSNCSHGACGRHPALRRALPATWPPQHASSRAWTGCPWRLSLRRRRPARFHWPRLRRVWTTDSPSSPPVRAPPTHATRRSAPSLTGAGRCSAPPPHRAPRCGGVSRWHPRTRRSHDCPPPRNRCGSLRPACRPIAPPPRGGSVSHA